MLRRQFIKGGSLTFVGIILLADFSPALGIPENKPDTKTKQSSNKIHRLYLHGDARSGCATPPGLSALLENGIASIMPY